MEAPQLRLLPRPSLLGELNPGSQNHGKTITTQRLSSYRKARKLSRVACRSCRQAKSRCDVTSDGSRPCTRCRRLSEDCRIDLTFKRKTEDAKLDELVKEVKRLQSVVESQGIPSSGVVGDDFVDTAPRVPAPTANGQAIAAMNILDEVHLSPQYMQYNNTGHASVERSERLSCPEESSASGRYVNASGTSARELAGILLTANQVDDLFRIYFEKYHPFLTILDPELTPDEYYALSPLLFWSVISVASRRFEEEPTLVSALSQSVPAMLWRCVGEYPHRRPMVDAVIILCVWPFPAPSLWTDPSVILVGIAKTVAMQLGLHNPTYFMDHAGHPDQCSEKEIREAIISWSACYIVAQCTTSGVGQESLFKRDSTIERACEQGNPYALPAKLRYRLLISRISVRISILMSENMYTPFGLPSDTDRDLLMGDLESGLDRLENEILGHCDVQNRLWLFCTRLQLRLFHFFDVASHNQRKLGLLKIFTTASTLIEMIVAEDSNSKFLLYSPPYIYRMLTIAAVVLLKTIKSNYSCNIDASTVKRNINAVIMILRQYCLDDSDTYGRSSKILARLWSLHQYGIASSSDNTSLRDLGANVLHGTLWTWKHTFDGEKCTAYTEYTGEDRAHEKDMAHHGAELQTLNMDENARYPITDFNITNWIWDLGLPL